MVDTLLPPFKLQANEGNMFEFMQTSVVGTAQVLEVEAPHSQQRRYTWRGMIAIGLLVSIPTAVYGAIFATFDLLVKGDEGVLYMLFNLIR